MHIEKLKIIQETLACVAEEQMYNLDCVDAKELGEVIDIIKDIEETKYYCAVTKAMKDSEIHEDNDNEVHVDSKTGKSYHTRRMYMESKEQHHDKTTQMKTLEKYVQELAQDVIEMIEDATPEERQYLSKKITALATKINSTSNPT